MRVANKSDLPQLIEWAKEFHKLTPWAGDELDWLGIERWLAMHMRVSDKVILITDKGAIGAAIAPPSPFKRGKYADETFWFGKGDGVRLLIAAERWAKAREATFRVATLKNSPEKARALLKRRGYTELETIWEGKCDGGN